MSPLITDCIPGINPESIIQNAESLDNEELFLTLALTLDHIAHEDYWISSNVEKVKTFIRNEITEGFMSGNIDCLSSPALWFLMHTLGTRLLLSKLMLIQEKICVFHQWRDILRPSERFLISRRSGFFQSWEDPGHSGGDVRHHYFKNRGTCISDIEQILCKKEFGLGKFAVTR
jgi:hypothetical protein